MTDLDQSVHHQRWVYKSIKEVVRLKSKLVEIRKVATIIPAIVTYQDNPNEDYLLHRAGRYPSSGTKNVVSLTNLETGVTCHDPSEWTTSRTMRLAHNYLIEYFDDVKNRDVIDIEFILGEVNSAKINAQYYQRFANIRRLIESTDYDRDQLIDDLGIIHREARTNKDDNAKKLATELMSLLLNDPDDSSGLIKIINNYRL